MSPCSDPSRHGAGIRKALVKSARRQTRRVHPLIMARFQTKPWIDAVDSHPASA
ncbi:hypothetical protein ACFPRL_00710 [Pseudoclavibacter helvolus]